ncbi:unnamed protein product [Clonostachys byssicola]|uniref:Uncharacterized protein n=1 Tax=Clonostachys byssicola TaxID=160290 RepID=A0A9N9U1V6_9HYPO|nr:unnamed protein product [Clonostachys byssicola]
MAPMNDQELQILNMEPVNPTNTPVSPPATSVIDHHANSDDLVLIHGLSDTVATSEDITPADDNDSSEQISIPNNSNIRDSCIVHRSEQKGIDTKAVGFYPVCKAWALEIASIVLGMLALVAIIVILAQFNNRNLPNWPLSITLNTLVAFLATISKAAILVPVSMALSQSQWGWFQQERPLYDFHVFDQASRGVWGSLLFLRRIHFQHFASIGAVLMVTSLLTSPITQLSISYPVRSVAVQGEANTGIIQSIFYSENGMKTDDVSRAINLAISLDTDGHFSTPSGIKGASCSTGNCTFETYHSLGVCLKVANISSDLRIEQVQDNEPSGIPLLDKGFGYGPLLSPGNKVWKVSLPGGPALAGQYGFSMFVDALNGNTSIGFQTSSDLLRTRLLSVVLIFTKPILSNSSLADPIPRDVRILVNATIGIQYEALEFLFHLCVQSYDTSINMGKENTRLRDSIAQPFEHRPGTFLDLNCSSVLDEFPLECLSREERANETMYLMPPYPNTEGVNASVEDKTFGIDYYTMEEIATAMIPELQTYQGVSDSPSEDPIRMGYGYLFGVQLFTRAIFSSDGLRNASERDNRIFNIFTNVATLLSSHMRTAPPPGSDIRFMNFTGQAWRDESYVLINWGWISFLACELVISASFLLLTIMSQSSQQRRYYGKSPLLYEDSKDSSLATLVALSGRCRDMVGGGLRPMNELEIATKGLLVKLDGNEVTPAEPC